LKDSGDIGSPPKRKSLWRGTEVPQRLHFQTLRAALFHGQLRKVRVTLKVNWKTDLSEIRERIDFFRRDLQSLDMPDMTND
jgi:hypothetical protein